MKILRWSAIVITSIVGVIAVLWAVGALYFDLPAPPAIRSGAALIWLLGALGGWCFGRPRARVRAIVAGVFAGILGWWLTIPPRQDRDWKPEVAVPGDATIDGDRVTIRNIRNFDYRSETDFDVRRDTRTYSLSKLRGTDMAINYWGSAFMAHPIVSFDFGDEGRICFSIETRPRRGQSYSALGGLYRQFELTYIACDERDVIRVRTNFRKGEDVYLYHLNLPFPEARERFLEYVSRLNELHARPQWYNALTTNCTTAIRGQHAPGERAPWDWRMLANGYGDEMLYERGVLDRSLPFAELKKRALINVRAQAANDAPDFSEKIRTHFAGDVEPVRGENPRVGGDRPISSARLIGARLDAIQSRTTWDFTDTRFTLVNRGEPLPVNVAASVLGPGAAASRVVGDWRFDERAGVVFLSNMESDGKKVDATVALPIRPAGTLRANFGTEQYGIESPETLRRLDGKR